MEYLFMVAFSLSNLTHMWSCELRNTLPKAVSPTSETLAVEGTFNCPSDNEELFTLSLFMQRMAEDRIRSAPPSPMLVWTMLVLCI